MPSFYGAPACAGSWQTTPVPLSPLRGSMDGRSPSPYYYLPDLDSPVRGFTPLCSPAPSSNAPPGLLNHGITQIGSACALHPSQVRRSPSAISSTFTASSAGGAPLTGTSTWEHDLESAEPEVDILEANGLTYGQAWYLWERARPALSAPFGGVFDVEDFNISLERICLSRGKQVTGAEVMEAFSEMAALWRHAEDDFVRGFETLLRKLTGELRAGKHPETRYNYWAVGDDDGAFHSQFRLIEQAEEGCKFELAG